MNDAAPLSPRAAMVLARQRALGVVQEVMKEWRSDRWGQVGMAEQERMIAARAPVWISAASVAAGTRDIMLPLAQHGEASRGAERMTLEDITRLSDLLTTSLQQAGLLAVARQSSGPGR